MLLRSPRNLHYPITVTELLKARGDNVERSAPLFLYFYKSIVTEGNDRGEEQEVEKTFPTRFEGEVDGKLVEWKIAKGTIIESAGVELVEIEEPCRHDVQYAGMCANCGKDMTEVDYNTSVPDTQRAKINMAHGNTALRVSNAEAARVEEDSKRRLLQSRKLSLVVDLDQTVIQACVDPTVGIWQKDPSNPNYEALKDVKAFQLLEEGPGRGTWYYVKQRPGLSEFLENISKLYELHIYTMATRAYATQIAKIVDPDRKLFGERILSRDESGSQHLKSLQRLFPMDTKMVLIIDDRGDVWNWSANLVKVTPYSFFPVGDINASFLPKRTDVAPQERKTSKPVLAEIKPNQDASEVIESLKSDVVREDPGLHVNSGAVKDDTSEGHPNGTSSALEHIVSLSVEGSLQQKEAQQEEVLAAQVNDRPLLQKQQALDKLVDEANEQEAEKQNNGDGDQSPSQESQQQHLPILQDDDTELRHLAKALHIIHGEWYNAYDKARAVPASGRVAQLKGDKAPRKRLDDLDVPDVTELMPSVKQRVLEGVELTFSGVLPLGIDVSHSDVGRWARSFGASISIDIKPFTTHVIAAKHRRTAKVREAAKRPDIKIVAIAWLFDSLVQWKRLSEDPYIIQVEPDKEHGGPTDLSAINSPEGRLSSSEEEDGFDNSHEADGRGLENQNLEVTIAVPTSTDDTAEPVSPIEQLIEEATAADYADWNAEIDGLEDTDNGSEDDDDTTDEGDDSDTSQQSTKSGRKRKAETTEGEESDVSVNGLGSKLQKRKKRALDRITGLTNMSVARRSPTPSSIEKTVDGSKESEHSGQQDEDDTKEKTLLAAEPQDGEDEDDEDDATFEADFAAQLLEAQEEEDAGG